MLRVERIKANIFCVNGIQFKPGVTEVSEPDATKLMNTRQFKGAITNGDMVILENSAQAKVANKPEFKPESKPKPRISRKTVIKIVNDCRDIAELNGMLESQKDNIIKTAIKSRIAFLSKEDTGEDAE